MAIRPVSAPDPEVKKKLDELIDEIATATISSTKVARNGIIISVIATLIAILSLFFSYRDSVDDKKWSSAQKESMTELSSKLTTLSESSKEVAPTLKKIYRLGETLNTTAKEPDEFSEKLSDIKFLLEEIKSNQEHTIELLNIMLPQKKELKSDNHK